MAKQELIKGRGAQINTKNKFDHLEYDATVYENERTVHIPVQAKTIINKVDSPDIPYDYSMNPYQGCEHGCVYCYARNTHNYWGYSAGLEFEQKILVKNDAPLLLDKKLASKNWQAKPIMLSGNTDCYQPVEARLGLTRAMLKVLLKWKHPVGIITKNQLIVRDLDILKALATSNLLKVAISITTLDESLRQKLEPRTATAKARLKTVETLAKNGIPVRVMMAPIIPGLNEHEIMEMAKQCAAAGATAFTHTICRLNGDVAEIFEDWLRKAYPDRADKVLNKIKATHGGVVEDSRFKKRMAGEGEIAKIINAQVQLAKQLYFKDKIQAPFNLKAYEQMKNPQLELF